MKLSRLFTLLLAVATPGLIYLGLRFFEPWLMGALLLVLLLLRHGTQARQFLHTMPSAERLLLLALVLFSLGITLSNSETLLRLYPTLMAWGMATVFARSLRHPPSVIERIARLSEPELSAAGVQYTRRVTQVWLGFMLINGAIALATSFASREIWVLWNGLIAYLLMGALFAGEWLCRRRHQQSQPV